MVLTSGVVDNEHSFGSESLGGTSSLSATSPFRTVSEVPETNTLLCPTAKVCYAADTQGTFSGSGFERTANGGASWRPTAPLPVHAFLTNPSCPTAEVCVGGAIELGSRLGPVGTLEMVETTDGGAHWRLSALAVPPSLSDAEVNELSCPSASFCVVLVSGFLNSGLPLDGLVQHGGTFFATRDSGKTWQPVGAPVDLTYAYSTTLRCEADGQCLSLVQTSRGAGPGTVIRAMSSPDFGRSWTVSTTLLATTVDSLLTSCGDAMHCVLVETSQQSPRGIPRGKAKIARTSDGGRTWSTRAAPTTWPNLPVALSCATTNDCFMSASTVGADGDSNAVLELTHDGGATWRSMAFPRFRGTPFVIVNPLSCPVAAGCIGMGATEAQFAPDVKPAVFNQRVIVSNLPN